MPSKIPEKRGNGKSKVLNYSVIGNISHNSELDIDPTEQLWQSLAAALVGDWKRIFDTKNSVGSSEPTGLKPRTAVSSRFCIQYQFSC